MTTFELSVRFFLQLAAVLVVCRLVCWVAVRLGQPPVVGEMIAGVILGPSLFGYFWPHAQQAFFPAASRPILFSGAQIGLSLYMFTVGLDFRKDLLQSRLRSALAISASGILVPFVLGCGLAWVLLNREGFFVTGVTAIQAIPFMGAAMAITAFPMLARIIFERGLSGTTVGALALAAGAIDDAAAWGVLALVLASLGRDPWIAVLAVGGSAVFIAFLFTIGQKLLGTITRYAARGDTAERVSLGWVMVLLMLASWYTDTIRLYAVFGAFFLGAAMPRGPFVNRLLVLIEPLTTALLLPLFFIYSGLNTRFDLVNDPRLWLVALAVLAAAVLGKAGACYLAARACGETHREAMGVGSLMNARGLMELIILNIGLERGIITPTLFSILVFMAIVTTLMATPMFNRFYRESDGSRFESRGMKPLGKATLVKFALILAVVAFGVWLAVRQVDVGAQATRCVAYFREAGPFAFFAAMAFLPIVGFPLSPFTLVAGPVFGPVMGVGNVILCSLLAVTVNVTISYWIAARALRPLVSRCVSRLGYTLPEIQPHAAWTVILLVRIVPGPPFFLQSYLLGLARVPFRVYMLVSTVVPAAYITATILFGNALMRGDRWAMAGAAALFLVAGGVLHQLRIRYRAGKPSDNA